MRVRGGVKKEREALEMKSNIEGNRIAEEKRENYESAQELLQDGKIN